MNAESKGKITYGIWGLILGASILGAYGFGVDGWMTGNTTKKMIADAVSTSQIATQASICVTQFMKEPNSKEMLGELEKLNDPVSRYEFISKGGWDKMPGQNEAISGVAQQCSYGLEEFMKK
jgi:hypothetical protein